MSGIDPVRDWLDEAWAIPPVEFSVDVEGALIVCRGWNLDAVDLPGIVLVHGFLAHARWWDHIAPALAETHRVIAFDLSGMGDSGRRPHYSREQHGREVLAVARAAGFDRAIIVAHSYGATCSLMACATGPEDVARLIVIDSLIPTAEDVDDRVPSSLHRIYPDRATAEARFRLVPSGEWPQPDVLAYIRHHAIRQTADGWTWKFDEQLGPSLNTEAYRLKMFGPGVLCDMIYGDRTELMVPFRRAELAAMAPKLRRSVAIPLCHHHVPVEQPLALIAALRGLLAD